MKSQTQTLRLLTANIQAGSSTRRYSDYVTRSWSHALPAGQKRSSLDAIAKLASGRDIVGLQEADPGSLRSGFTNQTHYLAERAGFNYWSHQPNRRMGGVASSANGLLSRLEPVEVQDHALPGRLGGRGVLVARFGDGDQGLTVAVAHLSLGMASRLSQLDFISDLLSDRPEMRVLYHKTRLQPPSCNVLTFPSWGPDRAIDHILLTDNLKMVDTRAVAAAHSDHLAVEMEVQVPGESLR